LNQLNISVQGIGKLFLDVSKTSSRLNIKHSCGSIEFESEKIAVFMALNAFAAEVEIDLRCVRQIFLDRLTTSLLVA